MKSKAIALLIQSARKESTMRKRIMARLLHPAPAASQWHKYVAPALREQAEFQRGARLAYMQAARDIKNLL